MKLGETKKIPYFRERETLRQGEFTAGRDIGNIVVAQPGLWATVEWSFFIQSLREKVVSGANFSLFAVDHPCYGLNIENNPYDFLGDDNSEQPYLDNFTLPACVTNTQMAIRHVLGSDTTRNVILAGNSLGFWSLFQSVCGVNYDHRIRGLLGKSWVSSYERILGRILCQFWYDENPKKAWTRMLSQFQIDGTTGNCIIEINNWETISIHENFFHSVGFIPESRTTPLSVESWQGENDTYTSPAEMQSHNWGNITVHVVPGVWHNLSAWPEDTTPARVHAEMIAKMEEMCEENT